MSATSGTIRPVRRASARRPGALRLAALVVLAVLPAGGCSLFRRPAPTVAPAPPVAPVPTVVAPPDPLDPAAARLTRAESLLGVARIEEAAGELHSLVDSYPSSAQAPQALFQLALVYLSPDSPLHDGTQGISLLRDLVDTYPGSSWSLASETILRLARTNADLRGVAEQLQQQLEELKRIDIGSDG
jgi:hypothetical protein